LPERTPPRKNAALGPYTSALAYQGVPVNNQLVRIGVFVGILLLLNVLSYVFGWGRIFY
jgi:hypothetical protein